MGNKVARLASTRGPRVDYGYEEWIGYIKSLGKVGVVWGENKLAGCLKVRGEGLHPFDDVRPATEEETQEFKKEN